MIEFDEDANRDDVVDLAEFLLAAHHLLVNAVRALGTPGDLRVHPEGRELASEDLRDIADKSVALFATARQPSLDQLVIVGIELHKGQILELALDLPDAESMSERGVDVERLPADPQPPLGGVRADGAHVVEAIAELDEHHADILGHGDEHLSDVLGLVLLGAAHVDLAQLGHAVDELRDLVAEEPAHFLAGHLRVLDGVMEQRGDDRLGIEAQVGEDAGDRERMLDVRLSGEPGLARVRAVRDVERASNRGLILRGEVLDTGHEVGDGHVLYECRARGPGSNTGHVRTFLETVATSSARNCGWRRYIAVSDV